MDNFSYISPNTILLYLLVVFTSSLFAFIADGFKSRSQKKNGGKAFLFFLFLAFLSQYLLLAFSACGADYDNYNALFNMASSFWEVNGHDGVEKGFTLLVFIIRLFTDNVDVYNGILGFIFLFLVYSTIYKLRNRINCGWAVFCFVTIFFFQYLDLKRIYLACSIIFFSVPYWMKGEMRKTFVILVIAVFFHVSSIVAFVPLILDIFTRKKLDTKKIIILSVFALLFLVVFRNYLLNFTFDERHADYGLVANASIGVIQFFYYIPIVYIIIKARNDDKSDRLYKICFLMSICAFGLGILSYYVEMIGRAYIHFMTPVLLFPSFALYKYNQNGISKRKGLSFIVSAFTLIYCTVRLALYFSSYLVLDQISPYTTINGLVF